MMAGLKLAGHEVSLATDGQMGLEYVLAHAPDLMVLDLSLPKKDGVQVLEELKGRLAGTSVLVLTGRSNVEERVKCLNLGADDCLIKPFSFNELMARCKALWRRRQQIVDTTLRHRGIEIDRLIELTGKEFALLEFLMQARGRCCPRSELLREVWQMSPDAGTNVVDVYVNYLRKKLSAGGPQDGALEPLIETVRGEGYMIGMGLERKPSRANVPDGLQGSLRGQTDGVFGVGNRYVA
jgi:DNA-binding response OmpR family regulator